MKTKILEFPKEIRKREIILFLAVLFGLLFFNKQIILAIEPLGANYSNNVTSTAPVYDPQGIAAQAGNVTRLDITGFSTTQYWQGYYGNVSGTIQLADGGGNALYNWSATSPQGEIYATNKTSIVNWGGITCFDLSADGDSIEGDFNISDYAVDGLNETFNLNDHDGFYTATAQFNPGQCNNTKLFNNSGVGIFDEVLLWDGEDLVYASILQKDVIGFDGNSNDFEMIVLENGNSGKATTTNYYFYVELQ